MSGRGRDVRLVLALLALGALVLRVVLVLVWQRHLDPQGDQVFYWRQGQDLADGYGFVFRNNFGERVPTAVHPPLHSAYLGVWSLLGFTSHAWHRIATAALGAVTVYVVGLAGLRVAGRRAAVAAAALAAVAPALWINDVMLLSESSYALAIALVLLAAYRYVDRPDVVGALAVGGAVGLAALARAEAQLLAALLLVPLPLLVRRERPLRARVASAAVALGAAAVVVAPWVVRNLTTFENPATLSSSTGFVLEVGNCDQTYGLAPTFGPDGEPDPNRSADEYLGYWYPGCDRTAWPPGDETVVEQAKRETALTYIGDHADRLPVVVAARIGRLWDVWRPGQNVDFNVFWERRGREASVLALAVHWVTLGLAAVGLVSLWRRRRTMLPIVSVLVMTTVTAAVSFGISRYRVGGDVALILAAGVGVDACVRAWWARRRDRTGPDGAAVGRGDEGGGSGADEGVVGAAP